MRNTNRACRPLVLSFPLEVVVALLHITSHDTGVSELNETVAALKRQALIEIPEIIRVAFKDFRAEIRPRRENYVRRFRRKKIRREEKSDNRTFFCVMSSFLLLYFLFSHRWNLRESSTHRDNQH